MKMFAFTTKHHEGFSMFDTRTRVKNRANWTAAGGPKIESCDLAYSIMETPFRRDIVKKLCDPAHKRDIKIDLYFSHPPCHRLWITPQGATPAKRIQPYHASRKLEKQAQLQSPKHRLAQTPLGTVKQSRLRPIPMAGFEVTTYGRF